MRRSLTRSKSRRIGRRKFFTSASQNQIAVSRINGKRALRTARRRKTLRSNRKYNTECESGAGCASIFIVGAFVFSSIGNIFLFIMNLGYGYSYESMDHLVLSILVSSPFVIYLLYKLINRCKFSNHKKEEGYSIDRLFFGGYKISLYKYKIEIDDTKQYLIEDIVDFDVKMTFKLGNRTESIKICNINLEKDMILVRYQINIITNDGNFKIDSKVLNESVEEMSVKSYIQKLIKFKSTFDSLKSHDYN